MRVWIRNCCPAWGLALERLGSCTRWERGPLWAGEATFAFLPPGEYRLTLSRSGRRLCRLLIRLSPGSNVELLLDGRRRCFDWRLNPIHCSYNAEG